MDAEKRIVELEIEVAYLKERVGALDDALTARSADLAVVYEDVRLLKEALSRLARRSHEKDDILQGGEDPVPSSG